MVCYGIFWSGQFNSFRSKCCKTSSNFWCPQELEEHKNFTYHRRLVFVFVFLVFWTLVFVFWATMFLVFLMLFLLLSFSFLLFWFFRFLSRAFLLKVTTKLLYCTLATAPHYKPPPPAFLLVNKKIHPIISPTGYEPPLVIVPNVLKCIRFIQKFWTKNQ